MPDIVARSADNPEFPRVVAVAALRSVPRFAFDIAPTETEAAALARLMGALRIERMRFKGALEPAEGGAWALAGRLEAAATQTCVVSLEPVTTRIDAPVRRLFAPAPAAAAGPAAVEIAVDLDEDEDVEPLGSRIDLGLVATEALALALPAYPRRPDAELAVSGSGPAGAAETAEETVKPFAGLAALRAKLDGGA
jgi:uncharacterized metal-binding protein YceD (DUF177 family)